MITPKISWWREKWSKNKLCGITMTRIRPGKNRYGTPYVTFLPCKHPFYTLPLCKWIKQSQDNACCPLCRHPFRLIDIIPSV